MGEYQRIFRQGKGRGIDVAIETLKTKHKLKKIHSQLKQQEHGRNT
jgi:hypothetical protein